MHPRSLLFALMMAQAWSSALATPVAPGRADLIVHNGKVWTVDDRLPVAEAVAVRDSRIVKVGSNAAVLALRDPSTRVIDVQGNLVLPGFNDAHTHFENAVDWFFQVRLVDVADEAELLSRLREAVARVPKGMWITGGDLSIYAWLAAQRQGNRAWQGFVPSLAAVDAIAPDHPILLRRFDHTYFANSKALRTFGITAATPDVSGGRYDRDPATGALTGLLIGTAGEHVEKQLPPASLAKKLIGARAVQAALNRAGITSIHDIARVDAISQEQVHVAHVERSFSNIEIFEQLRKRGELTLRIHAITPLASWSRLASHGIHPYGDDEFITYGTLKDFVDGTMMFAPLGEGSSYLGGHSYRFADEQSTRRHIVEADAAGFDVGSHVLGDRGLNLLLERYEGAIKANKTRDRRFRLIHAELARLADLERAGRMRLIADITPRHLLGLDVAAFERNLGPERAKTAFAWRTMIENGIRLNLVSDMPGSFSQRDISPYEPLRNIYSAITRKDPDRGPPEGWHVEQRLTIGEAIRAYTANPAFASREEDRKGSITEGKLADLVVLSRDITTVPADELLRTQVEYTILGGRVVYRRE